MRSRGTQSRHRGPAPRSSAAPGPGPAERGALGKALRERLPRGELGGWAARRREGGVVGELSRAVAGRRADLLPIRWGRMARSPFDFFRGAAAIMAADVGPGPSTGLRVQLCGDAHLLNLGAHQSPEGHLVFDLDDFDETCRGPFEWDLRRLAASFAVGGRVAGHRDRDCAGAVRTLVHAYREQLAVLAPLPRVELPRVVVTPRSAGRPLAPIFGKAARDTPEALLAKVTAPGAGGYARFRSAPPVQVRLSGEVAQAVRAALTGHVATLGPGPQQVLSGYALHDLASRVVGTGSVGLLDYLVLLYGNGPGDPLFLQLKEARPSCWRPPLSAPPGSVAGRGAAATPGDAHHGRRVAEGQLRTQGAPDPFLGWTRIGARDFVVRQWSDHKASQDVRLLGKRAVLEEYAVLCGRVLARAHARTGDAAMLAGYCGAGGRLDEALAAFALAYADQTEADHAALRQAIRAGRLPARRGV